MLKNLILTLVLGVCMTGTEIPAKTAAVAQSIALDDEQLPVDSESQFEEAQRTASEVTDISEIPEKALFILPRAATTDTNYYYKLPGDENYYKISEDTFMDFVKEYGAFPEDNDDFSSGTGILRISATLPSTISGSTVRLYVFERNDSMPTTIDLAPPYRMDVFLPSGSYFVAGSESDGLPVECSKSVFLLARGSETYLDIKIYPAKTAKRH